MQLYLIVQYTNTCLVNATVHINTDKFSWPKIIGERERMNSGMDTLNRLLQLPHAPDHAVVHHLLGDFCHLI